MPTAQRTLETWLEQPDIPRVLRGLQALAEQHQDKTLKSAALSQSSRYRTLRDQRNKGLISQADSQLEEARIREALIQLITDLPAEWDDTPLADIPPTKRKRRQRKPIAWARFAAGAAAVIAVLAGLAEFTGYSLRDLWTPNPPPTDSTQVQPTDSLATTVGVPGSAPPESVGAPGSAPPESVGAPGGAPPESVGVPGSAPPESVGVPGSAPPKSAEVPTRSTPDTTLRLQAKTERGRANLKYAAGDTWRLYAQASQPCHLRVIYRLADGRLVLLIDDQQLIASETDQWIDLTGEYEVSAPYGSEAFYLFAQTQPFDDLQTVWEPDGYTRVTEGLPSALRKIRGFKKKHRYAEDSLQIHTYESL